ncbi:FAD-dependent oxidoreductase [Dactylosporangium sp. McL0621]|uniref:FAD-dependent oxidoreductase n=1 Tax=Dactylosporangium sp. McL0621 TaxID=3415678 RepID=UPI003CEC239D
MVDYVADRAVVLGGGIGGLLAARILADSYRHVSLVDRDRLLGVRDPRRGVPHGRHAHALLAKGQHILEELFPGLDKAMAAEGVLAGDLSGNLRWYFNGKRLSQARTGLSSVSATRPVLEAHVRARVAELSNVEFLEGCTIRGLVTTADRKRVIGVEVLDDGAAAATQVLRADLVVDATGRGSRMPAWLEEFGYARPAEDRVKIDMAYTTRHFRLREDPYGTDLSINPVASPAFPRGAFFPKLGDGVSMLSLTGILGDYPPTDHEGFLAFARSLPAPEIYETIRTAEPVDEAVSFRVAASVWRRFDRLREFPAGLLVFGDAVCAFNPVYGQGMTAAALEAVALREHLQRFGDPQALRFFREIKPLIGVPWEISTGGDLGFPGVEGPRTLKVRLANAYMSRLHAAAVHDGAVTRTFFRVAGLVDPPTALMSPGTMLRVLRGGRATGPAPAPEHALT